MAGELPYYDGPMVALGTYKALADQHTALLEAAREARKVLASLAVSQEGWCDLCESQLEEDDDGTAYHNVGCPVVRAGRLASRLAELVGPTTSRSGSASESPQ